MAVIFEVTSYEAPRQWTGLTNARGERAFGPVGVTYAAEPDPAGSRIVCRFVIGADGRVARLRAHGLAWGDLVMMRKQLRTFKKLAERDARRGTQV